MSVKPVSNTCCTDCRKLPDKDQKNSHVGKCVGLAAGLALSGALVYSQLNVLKTIRGKKALVDEFHFEGKTLNDFMPKKPRRDDSGRIIPYVNAVSDRTKAIVSSYKKELFGWGAFITAVSTTMGFFADKSISAVNKKECKDCAKCACPRE